MKPTLAYYRAGQPFVHEEAKAFVACGVWEGPGTEEGEVTLVWSRYG